MSSSQQPQQRLIDRYNYKIVGRLGLLVSIPVTALLWPAMQSHFEYNCLHGLSLHDDCTSSISFNTVILAVSCWLLIAVCICLMINLIWRARRRKLCSDDSIDQTITAAITDAATTFVPATLLAMLCWFGP